MVDERIQTILQGMDAGTISRREADALLKTEFGTTVAKIRPEKQQRVHLAVPILVGLAFVLISIFGVFMMWGENPTGLVSYDLEETGVQNATYVINQTIIGLTASGTLYGDGTATITLRTSSGTFIVGIIESDTGEPRTDKPSYSPGDEVGIEYAPEDSTYYLDDGVGLIPVNLPFSAPNTTQELLIVANETGEITTYRIPIIIGEFNRETVFTEICDQTCVVEATKGNITISTIGEAFLNVQLSGSSFEENQPPILETPYASLIVDGTTVIDLSGHFTDAEELLYSTSNGNIVTPDVDGTLLTLVPTQLGTEELRIYVSDLEHIVETTMNITVVALDTPESNVTIIINETTPPVTNETTENETVITEIPSSNLTNGTNISSLDCSAADPNQRPIDCLNLESAVFFEENIFWESVSRDKVARFTPIGNLLIKGNVIEQSSATPASSDFKISYKDSDFNTLTTIWIDSSGNLHLTGRLYEETHNVIPPSGSYAVINRRGVYLAYANKQSGDLFIRGNIIPYRRSIT